MVGTSRVEVDADAGFVRFKPLLKADEHAQYNCTATNDVGFDSDIGQLRVFGRSRCPALVSCQTCDMRASFQSPFVKGGPNGGSHTDS